MAYTNHYTTGPVTITKAVIGPGADPWGVHTFTLHLECTLANADPTTVYSADHVIDKADPVWEVTDLPTGATCQVTETATGGASFTFTDPVDGKVAVGDSTPVTIDVVNVFQLGSIEVTKHLAGDVDENQAIATGTYTVSLGCTVGSTATHTSCRSGRGGARAARRRRLGRLHRPADGRRLHGR